ncbi:MAG: 50S ribosomal protein L5 [Gemmatimonadetes bacterium]|nr:50S ribosomal protein L5 [Gemmatimonadota bacterium]
MAKKDKAQAAPAAAPDEPVEEGPRVKPRLQRYYEESVRAKLQEQFGFQSPMQVPRLEKITINVGLGEAPKNPKLLEGVVGEIGQITGQKPVITKAKKAISNFSLRENQPVGVTVTLRRDRMWEFLDRLINVAMPRIRDFRGVPTRSFDGRGNYTMGVKEQLIFPEIDYDKVEKVHGMDISFVTSTTKDDEALALLRELGMPFRGESPVLVAA